MFAFTLIELLAVLVCFSIISALALPAFTSIKAGADLRHAANRIAAILEQARAHAMANNTYVYVGLMESDVSQEISLHSQRPGIGRVILMALASSDGTRGYQVSDPKASWSANAIANQINLVPVSKVWHFENIHMAASLGPPPDHGAMGKENGRHDVGRFYRLGHPACKSVTPILYPPGTSQYEFRKVIQFDPQGVARIQYESNGDEIKQYMEIGLQPARGNALPPVPADANTGLHYAIQLNCMTGSVRIFQP